MEFPDRKEIKSFFGWLQCYIGQHDGNTLYDSVYATVHCPTLMGVQGQDSLLCMHECRLDSELCRPASSKSRRRAAGALSCPPAGHQ